jgi:hypothetical protein
MNLNFSWKHETEQNHLVKRGVRLVLADLTFSGILDEQVHNKMPIIRSVLLHQTFMYITSTLN